ncbi:hypothetical protein QJ854_gp540 [Moumouvirus goulette]|uniref:Uncharacterized protein n=1 Tax=Moumouvirus goulette TaxID=1247379 RepID=M1PWV4_9VIRU|nr:hypothetical protein QJ854_gp540 [Moumouvirus goulette]AGF85242.1 hypothetical protein glt_00433 [Moumouvirus goulette]
MNKILCHIIGLDEIHKKKLIKSQKNIKFIDLDNIQQKIHNDQDIIHHKNLWNDISKKIFILKNQQKILKQKNKTNNDINDLICERNEIKKKIHNFWKEKIKLYFLGHLNKCGDKPIIIIGFNIFPKDYRIKFNIDMLIFSTRYDDKFYNNKIIYDISSIDYASNQIKFYLNRYQDKIIKGTFPLNLLKQDYLISKYQKFTDFYLKQGYNFVTKDFLVDIINQFYDTFNQYSGKINNNNIIYIAIIFKAGKIIPANNKMPIEGFITRQEALENIKPKINNTTPVYLYESNIDQFEIQNGKFISTKPINIINEESLLLTI